MRIGLKTDSKKAQCILLSLLFLSLVIAVSVPCAQGNESGSAVASTTSENEQKDAVINWFKKYDQIRRDAELNFLEKIQTMFFLDKNLDHTAVLRKRDKELVERMSTKYARASEEMKNLPEVSATRELQDGYIDYFAQVHEIFTAYLKDPTVGETPCSPSSIQETRSALEELDFNNKKLDAELRQKYGIARHRHS